MISQDLLIQLIPHIANSIQNHDTRRTLNQILAHFGYEIVRTESVYDWQRESDGNPSHTSLALPRGAREYLHPDNPRLLDLKKRYSLMPRDVSEHLLWNEGYVGQEEMLFFRGDNPFMWQLRGQIMGEVSYALTAYYAMSNTIENRLLAELDEDGLFGNHTFIVRGRRVSRDLLDSVIEISFLERHLHISRRRQFGVIDIGAGYGRLAHRMVTAFNNVQYLCTDAVPVSTFLCEYYLDFRHMPPSARAVPLDEVATVLPDHKVDLAVNINSFGECHFKAIRWWLSLLLECKVRYLFIVPNSGRLRSGDGVDYGDLLTSLGYRLIVEEPKYLDPIVQKYGVNPTMHYLFRLE